MKNQRFMSQHAWAEASNSFRVAAAIFALCIGAAACGDDVPSAASCNGGHGSCGLQESSQDEQNTADDSNTERHEPNSQQPPLQAPEVMESGAGDEHHSDVEKTSAAKQQQQEQDNGAHQSEPHKSGLPPKVAAKVEPESAKIPAEGALAQSSDDQQKNKEDDAYAITYHLGAFMIPTSVEDLKEALEAKSTYDDVVFKFVGGWKKIGGVVGTRATLESTDEGKYVADCRALRHAERFEFEVSTSQERMVVRLKKNIGNMMKLVGGGLVDVMEGMLVEYEPHQINESFDMLGTQSGFNASGVNISEHGCFKHIFADQSDVMPHFWGSPEAAYDAYDAEQLKSLRVSPARDPHATPLIEIYVAGKKLEHDLRGGSLKYLAESLNINSGGAIPADADRQAFEALLADFIEAVVDAARNTQLSVPASEDTMDSSNSRFFEKACESLTKSTFHDHSESL